MSIKVENIMTHLKKHRRVTLNMARESGANKVVVSMASNGCCMQSSNFNSNLVNATLSDVRAFLQHNRMFINSWS